MADKKQIVSLLEDISDMMEFLGENRFKVNAFRNGANTLRRMEDDLDELVQDKTLNQIKGIGKGLQAVIYEFYESGTSQLYDDLKQKVPEGISDILKIRGLGSKKVKVLYDELGISTVGELEYACNENRLALLKGFGKTTQDKILKEIEKLKFYNKFILLSTAEKLVDKILALISKLESVNKISVAGEFRRGMEIISSIDFVVLITEKKAFENELKTVVNFEHNGNKLIIKEDYNIPITFILTYSEEEYDKEFFIATGSKEFLEKLKIDFSGISGKTEEEYFEEYRASFVIPEMREKEYFDVKDKKLLTHSDLSTNKFHGLLHFHTTFSDGRNTLEEMISEAKKEGFMYAVVCDHSKSAFYANGLTEERVLQQKQEIKTITSKIGLMVFHGIESDILQNGELDYSNDFLSNFDFVVASIHSRFSIEHDAMTNRIIKAVENPNTDLIAHPSGRLLLSREPYKFDVKKVIDACSANNVAIEINANPHRLDLDWRLIYYAREKGCLVAINPDAHSTGEIDYIKYGVMMGRKGGLMTSEVINCFSLAEFRKFLSRKVKRNFN